MKVNFIKIKCPICRFGGCMCKTNEGNKTYSSTAFQSSNNYTNGNYTMLTKIKYSCVVANFERDERRIQVDTDEPTISEIYPTNSLQINISSNATITLSPRIIATDTLGIKNKTIFDGTNTISLLDNPSYSKTLSPGVYSWNFTAIDLAGNAKTVTSQFRIFSSTTNETQPFNTTNTTQQNLSNTTLFFDSKTTPDNQLTNISSIHITLNANSNESQTNITLKIFDETGKVIYQNSTTEKTIEITYPFISDGTYYYNATFISGNSITNTATRKIIIDTEPPTITINSPTKKQTSFTNSVLIEFSAEDTNDVIKKWINDGTKKIDYTSKLNKTLSEGNYTWTLYAQDKAGNIAQETIRFSIVTEKKTNTIQRLAILIIIVAVILLVILIIFYFLKNKSNPTSSTSDQSPPSNPSQSFNRPVPPINPQVQRPMLRLANPAMFKNNQFQR